MDLNQRKRWNENHKHLTDIILKTQEHENVIALFLHQHQLLHSSRMSDSPIPTLEDALVDGLMEQTFRKYPVDAPDTRNPIAWHLWHMTRIEDMTMNVLVQRDDQVYHAGQWSGPLNVRYPHSGNEMTEDEMADMSAHIDLTALLAYRVEVGRKTRHIIAGLRPGDFKKKVGSSQIQMLIEQEAVKPEASWLLDYWGKKSVAGLILMPATRHTFLHLNKSIRLKERLQKKMKHTDETISRGRPVHAR